MSEAYDRLVGTARAHPSGAAVDLFYCRRCGAIVGSKDKHELMVHEKMAPSTMADILAKVDEVLEASEAAWGEFPIVGNDYPLGRIVGLLSELRGLRKPSGERPSFSRSDSIHGRRPLLGHSAECRCNGCIGAPPGLPSEEITWATKEDRP